MTLPLIAKMVGLRAGTETLPDATYEHLNFATVLFDTGYDPAANPPSYGNLVRYADGTPSGNICFPKPGYYRLKAAITWQTASVESSNYLVLRNLGPNGDSPSYVHTDNVELPPGTHPTNQLDAIIKIEPDENGALPYYDFAAQVLSQQPGNPPTRDLHTETQYAWCEVEFLGDLS